jgi:phage host-nuclease inhibitor protein Gam
MTTQEKIAARQSMYTAKLHHLQHTISMLTHAIDEHVQRAASDSYGTGYLAHLDHVQAQLDTLITASGALMLS